MKTFKQLITEAKSYHDNYSRWGVMDRSGKLTHGNDHPTAMMHSDLEENKPSSVEWAQEHPNPNGRDSSWGIPKYHLIGRHTQTTSTLNIRTRNKQGLAAAIKHFNRMPHVPGRQVEWEHVTPAVKIKDSPNASGDAVKVHNLMKAHYEKHYGKLEDQ